MNNSDQLLNHSTTPSNSLFDGHINKYSLSQLGSSYGVREDSLRKNFEMWKLEMDENSRKVCLRV